MSYRSDPTASLAIGSVSHDFSKQEKRAKALCRRYLQGRLSPQEWEAARASFKGIYRHVPDHVLAKMLAEQEAQKAQP